MKPFLTVLFISSIILSVNAQKNPDSFLARIPALPDEACSLNETQRSEYLDKISRLHNELKEEIDRRKDEADVNAENMEDNVKQNMAKQYGISDADMKKMQEGNLSEADKKALIQKMMKSGMNNPGNQKKNMESYELASEQKLLIDKIKAQDTAFNDKLLELNKADTNATREYKAEVDPLFAELSTINDGEGATDQDEIHRNNVQMKISSAGDKYCSKMTPLYYDILNQRLTVLKSSLPDYRRLEEVVSQLNKNTTGVEKDIAAPGLMELEAIEEYISTLHSVFKYTKN